MYIKLKKIRKKYTRCTCTISVSHESWWACNDVWLFDNFCQPHWSINYINAMIWKQGLISLFKKFANHTYSMNINAMIRKQGLIFMLKIFSITLALIIFF